MAWNDITITEAGEHLLSGMVNGSKLIITRTAIGAGTVSVENLSSLTEIIDPISAPAQLAGQERTEDGKGKIIKIQIRNDGVTATTRMRQVAIYAKTDHEDEVLFVILQDEIGEEIPAYNEFPQFEIEQWVTLTVSRTNNITVNIAPVVYATLETVYNSVEISSNPVPSAGVRTHYYIVKTIPVYNPNYPIPGVENGYLETDCGTAEGYIQNDENVLPMAVLSE